MENAAETIWLGLLSALLSCSAHASDSALKTGKTHASAQNEGAVVSKGATPADPSAQKHEDPRFSIRSYRLGSIQSIVIKSRKYVDADGQFCRYAQVSDKLSKRHIRYFLKHAESVSDGALASYYHEWGECYSSDAIVTFGDGRRIAISFSDEGATAYVSPMIRGKKIDSFPHICRPCGGETFN